jgi:hypothetical protein
MVVIPALAMDMVCCSMASWMATLSCSRILSNCNETHICSSGSSGNGGWVRSDKKERAGKNREDGM